MTSAGVAGDSSRRSLPSGARLHTACSRWCSSAVSGIEPVDGSTHFLQLVVDRLQRSGFW